MHTVTCLLCAHIPQLYHDNSIVFIAKTTWVRDDAVSIADHAQPLC